MQPDTRQEDRNIMIISANNNYKHSILHEYEYVYTLSTGLKSTSMSVANRLGYVGTCPVQKHFFF